MAKFLKALKVTLKTHWSKWLAAAILAPGFFVLLSFQNCAPVNFQSALPEQSKASLSGDQDGEGGSQGEIQPEQTAPVPELPPAETVFIPPAPTPVPPKPCVDDKGVSHDDSSTWVVETESQNQITCPDSDTRRQTMLTTESYVCKDGAISLVSTNTMPKTAAPECPAPSLMVAANPVMAPLGTIANLIITSKYVSSVSYTCKETGRASDLASGTVQPGTSQVPVIVNADVTCDVVATNSAGVKLESSVTIPVECGNKIKNGGKCEDFSCKEFRTITIENGLLEVPARSAAGICYTVKLMDAIAASASTLTQATDAGVISRNHGTGAATRNPFVMGKSLFDLKLAGPREVKLAGSSDRISPILVDNFVLTAIYPKSEPVKTSHYHAYGTSDSTIPGESGIRVGNDLVPVNVFATGGTSTIAPLNITNQITAAETFTMDIRSLDCGGTRHMSEIYLLLQ